jgi:hypothetical protein
MRVIVPSTHTHRSHGHEFGCIYQINNTYNAPARSWSAVRYISTDTRHARMPHHRQHARHARTCMHAHITQGTNSCIPARSKFFLDSDGLRTLRFTRALLTTTRTGCTESRYNFTQRILALTVIRIVRARGAPCLKVERGSRNCSSSKP